MSSSSGILLLHPFIDVLFSIYLGLGFLRYLKKAVEALTQNTMELEEQVKKERKEADLTLMQTTAELKLLEEQTALQLKTKSL